MKPMIFTLSILLSLMIFSASAIAETYFYPKETYAFPGSQAEVETVVKCVPPAALDAGGFEMEFDSNILTFDTVYSDDFGGTLLGDVVSPGVLRIGWFVYPPMVVDEGSIWLVFTVKENCNGASILDINSDNGGAAILSCENPRLCIQDDLGNFYKIWADVNNQTLLGMFYPMAYPQCIPNAFEGWYQWGDAVIFFQWQGKLLFCCDSYRVSGTYNPYENYGSMDWFCDNHSGSIEFLKESCN